MLQMLRKFFSPNKLVIVMTFAALVCATPAVVFAGTTCGGGNGEPTVKTTIDLGCQAKGNPIMDMLFAIIRLLSDGVGLVIIGSFIVGGIQYSSSRGDPQSSAKAIGRIQATFIALLIYIFSYAILNYVIPGGFLH